MVTKTITTFTDDIDRKTTEDVKTVTFTVDDAAWTIDLGPENKKALMLALHQFIVSGRRVRLALGEEFNPFTREIEYRPKTARKKAPTRDDLPAVKAWLEKTQNRPLDKKGRISKEEFKAYDSAH